MAFRDLLTGTPRDSEEVSVEFEMRDRSESTGGGPIVFNNVLEAPGHSAALNVLVRDRLCEVFDVSPGELIDTLAWGMSNPSEPMIVDSSEAEVLENHQEEVDLRALPIPWHYPEDRGRYQSASVIIAEYNGIRNMSYHCLLYTSPSPRDRG